MKTSLQSDPYASVKTGFAGLNFGGCILERFMQTEKPEAIDIVAVCDLDEKKTRQWSGRLSVPGFTDLAELLKSDIEAVALFTGPNGRAKLIRQIIDAGKHVLTTKPFERNAKAAREILEYAQSRNAVIHLNSPGPVDTEEERKITEWQTEHQLGGPIAARYEIWAGRTEQADGSWYDDDVQCPGGPLYRLGIYAVNTLVRLLGQPESVQVLASRMFTGRPTPDNATMSIRFQNGALGNIYTTLAMSPGHPYKKQMTLFYHKGVIYRDIWPTEGAQGCGPISRLKLFLRNSKGEPFTHEATVKSNGYHWEEFRRAVRGEPLINPTRIETIIQGTAVTEAMARAFISGKTEAVADA